MTNRSGKVIRVIKRIGLASVILLLAANLFQYFAEPEPVDILENPTITLLTAEARPGDRISYHVTAIKNTSQDAITKRVLVCEVGDGAYTNISLEGATQSAPEGKIDATIFVPLVPIEGTQIPPEVYGNYCYLRNSATYPKIHKQFTLFGLGDYADSDGVDDGFTTYVYDSYNCRDRAGDCDRSKMLRLLPPLDEAEAADTTGAAQQRSNIAIIPKVQTGPEQQDPESSGGDDNEEDGADTPPPAVTNPVIDTINELLGGARGLVNGIIRP